MAAAPPGQCRDAQVHAWADDRLIAEWTVRLCPGTVLQTLVPWTPTAPADGQARVEFYIQVLDSSSTQLTDVASELEVIAPGAVVQPVHYDSEIGQSGLFRGYVVALTSTTPGPVEVVVRWGDIVAAPVVVTFEPPYQRASTGLDFVIEEVVQLMAWMRQTLTQLFSLFHLL
jgi:hypothetical protein